MLNRAYKVCSDWLSIDKEIKWLKQVFTNNTYPMALVDREVNRFPASKFKTANSSIEQSVSPVSLYYKNQMKSNYKQDETTLRKIISDNVRPTTESPVQLLICYRNWKLSSLLIQVYLSRD